jgi:NO-binding membrane sensor protein with MHYT domain
MADVEHLTYGLVNPLFALGMAALGNLLGLILATKARGHTGRSRLRLLVYASIAFGGTGIWVPSVVAMLGFSVPDYVLRYALQPLAASFGIAVIGVAAGLAIACTGRTRALRLLLGGLLIGAAIAGTNLALVMSVRVGGAVSLRDNLFAASVGAALVTAGLVVGLLAGLRRLWVALAAATLLALAVTTTQYLTSAAIRVELGVAHPGIAGVEPILLFAVVILLSTTTLALLWFFSVGTATRSDLRAVFATHRTIEIEAWMIEEVTSRIAATDLAPPSTPASARRRPAWATAAMVSNGAAMATNARPSRTDRANTRTPVPWVSNPTPVEPAADERSSTTDDTDVIGLGAALYNAARITEALNEAATERGAPVFDLPNRTPSTSDRPTSDRYTSDRTASGLPIRGRTAVQPEPATVDSTAGGDVAVLTEVEPDPAPLPEGTSEEPAEAPKGSGRRGRWRNRRR